MSGTELRAFCFEEDEYWPAIEAAMPSLMPEEVEGVFNRLSNALETSSTLACMAIVAILDGGYTITKGEL